MSTIPEVMPTVSARSRSETARIFLDIARPKVIALVMFTGVPALALGKDGWPSLSTAVTVLFGTALAGAACSALNAYVERDSDAKMARTRERPIPAATLLPNVVLWYGLTLSVLSTVVLYAIGGPVAAIVGVATILFYVGVYTMWLKPRTPQNIVIGGAAGATAPLIASAAMDGHISIGAWILFGIVFLWTPPHFWAIALFRKSEYANAGIPMMPSVVGNQPTRWRMLAYTLLLVPFTLLPVWLGYLNWLYAIAGAVLGVWFTSHVIRSLIAQDVGIDRQVFRTSIAYLSFLFLAMLVDMSIPWGSA